MNFRNKSLPILLVTLIAIAAVIVVTVHLVEVNTLRPDVAWGSPIANYYLDNSSLFVLSTTVMHGYYPFEMPAFGPISKGSSCFIINTTIRNDYSPQNLPPNQMPREYPNGTISNESTSVYAFFTASIYDKQGNKINAIDVTPPYGHPNGGAFVSLQSGENATVTIYLATSRQDIDNFYVNLRYVGNIPLP
jgi:hypothetical protein